MADVVQVVSTLVHDLSTLCLIAIAVSTAHFSVARAFAKQLHTSAAANANSDDRPDTMSRTYSTTLARHVAMFLPFAAACTLVLFFYLFDKIGPFLICTSAVVGFVAIYFVTRPNAGTFVRQCIGLRNYLGNRLFSLRRDSQPAEGDQQTDVVSASRIASSTASAVSSCIAALLILAWLFTGHWVLNDIIGISLCILFASLIRAPSLKVVTVLLCGLLVYDVVFVFFSERFVGKNVMVQVASSAAKNPVTVLSELLDLPLKPVAELAFPGKLVFPSIAQAAPPRTYCILGLGDVIIPSMLLVFLCGFDNMESSSAPRQACLNGYYCQALITYTLGLALSFLFNIAYNAAQPALLYIVPAMLLPTFATAFARGQLLSLWNGTFGDSFEYSEKEEEQPLTSHIYYSDLSGLV